MPGQLVAGTVALIAARALLTIPRSGPIVVIDEIGYLTNARVLGGGVPGQMGTGPFYRGGYSLVLSPLMALLDDPDVVYHLVLALNAVLVAALFPLLYVLLTDGFQVGSRRAVPPAFVAAAYPTVTLTSQGAMSENLLLPLTAAWLVCAVYLLRPAAPLARLGWAVALSSAAAGLYAAHGRMLVSVALSAALLVWLAFRRRLSPTHAAVGLAVLAGGMLAAKGLNDFLATENYNGRHFDDAGDRLSTLDDLDGILAFARNLVGQAWYLFAATFGVALFLIGSPRAWRAVTAWRADTPVEDLMLGLVLATTAGLLVLSALSFSDVIRADMLVYGRYVEVIVPPLLAVGLAELAAGRSGVALGRAAWILLGLTAIVAALRLTIDVPGGDNGLALSSVSSRLRTLPPSWAVEALILGGAATALVYAARQSIRPRVLAVAFVIFSGCALLARLGLDIPEGGNRWMVASLPFRTQNLVPTTLVSAGLIAAAAACLLILLARRRPAAVALAVLVLFAGVTVYSEKFVLDYTREVYPAGWTSPQGAFEGQPPERVAYDMDHYNLQSLVYQWFLPDTRVLLFYGSSQPPPAPFVFSSRVWEMVHRDQPATPLWSDPGRDETLWRLDSAG